MTDTASLRACTFTVRYDAPDDRHSWDERRPRVLETVSDIDSDVLACQEPLAHQYDDLRDGLERYEWHGVGRRDGDREGESVPVAWRADRFERLEAGAFWLSETPSEPSVGWDAELPRVATWVSLRDRRVGTDGRLWVCSVHLDHRGERARLESARLLRRRATDRLADGATVLVMGDCNCTPGSPPHRTLAAGPLADARRAATDVRGPAGTFHGFDGEDGIGNRIDYAFVPSSADVREYRVLPPNDDGPRSDHLPVVATVDPAENPAAFVRESASSRVASRNE